MPSAWHFGMPVKAMHSPRGCSVGYEGVLSFGERLVRAVENPNYFRLLQRESRGPYAETWFEQDPFVYLRLDQETSFGV